MPTGAGVGSFFARKAGREELVRRGCEAPVRKARPIVDRDRRNAGRTEGAPLEFAAELARKVNAVIAQAVQAGRAYPAVKVRTAGSNTYPVYGKNSRNIEGWRMRSTLALESREAAPLSELIGKLQQTMAVAGLNAAPSPETWKKVEDEAIADALAAFEARARLVAGSLHKKWKIKRVAVNSGNAHPPRPMVQPRP